MWFERQSPQALMFEYLVPVGSSVLLNLGGVSSLKEVCHCWVLKFKIHALFPVLVVCFWHSSICELSACCQSHHVCFPTEIVTILSSWNCKPKSTHPSISCLGHGVSSQQQKIANTVLCPPPIQKKKEDINYSL